MMPSIARNYPVCIYNFMLFYAKHADCRNMIITRSRMSSLTYEERAFRRTKELLNHERGDPLPFTCLAYLSFIVTKMPVFGGATAHAAQPSAPARTCLPQPPPTWFPLHTGRTAISRFPTYTWTSGSFQHNSEIKVPHLTFGFISA